MTNRPWRLFISRDKKSPSRGPDWDSSLTKPPVTRDSDPIVHSLLSPEGARQVGLVVVLVPVLRPPGPGRGETGSHRRHCTTTHQSSPPGFVEIGIVTTKDTLYPSRLPFPAAEVGVGDPGRPVPSGRVGRRGASSHPDTTESQFVRSPASGLCPSGPLFWPPLRLPLHCENS